MGQLRGRNPAAVEKRFNTYAGTLYTFIYYRMAKDGDLAAELVRETFLDAVRKIEGYDAEKGGSMPG